MRNITRPPAWRIFSKFIWMLGTPSLFAAEELNKASPQVTVELYNSKQISPRDLDQAEEQAAKIFRKVRIKIVWRAGLMRSDIDDKTVVDEWNPTHLRLRIWTRSQIGSRVVEPNLLGFCLSIESGAAVLLWDEITTLAALDFTDPGDLLGLALAHEMGHLLLRMDGHSTTGIMQAHFPRDIRDVDRRALLAFSKQQGKLMRQEILRREAAFAIERTRR